jgi:hypothetical protein
MTSFEPSVEELAALIRSTNAEIAKSREERAAVSSHVSSQRFSTSLQSQSQSQKSDSSQPNPIGSDSETNPFAQPITEALVANAEETEWVWEGYVALFTVTLLAGLPKVGKTTTLFGLIRSIMDGLNFAGRATVATGVLLLSEERPPSLREKTERFGLDGRVHLVMRHQVGGMSWPEIVTSAVAYAKTHDLGVIVVDTLDKWWGLRGDQENSSGAVLEAFMPLAWAAGEGLAVLISTHQRKSGGEHGEAVRGSNALTGAVDVIVELERGKGELDSQTTRILKGTSRFEATPERLALRLDDGRFIGDDPEAAEEKAQSERVLGVLSDDPLDSAAIVEASGISKATVSRRLSDLHAEGLVEREGAGRKGDPYRYRLSDTGTRPDIGGGDERPTDPEDGAFAEGEREPHSEPRTPTTTTATTPSTPVEGTVRPGASLTPGTMVIDTTPTTQATDERAWCPVCREGKRTIRKAAYPGLAWLVCGHRPAVFPTGISG